jgi:hypothetical protein
LTVINSEREEAVERLAGVLKLEVNVKAVKWRVEEGADWRVELEMELTPELVAEGQARELMRTINGLRKEKKLAAGEKWEYRVAEIPAGWREEIERRTSTRLVGAV